MKKKKSENQGKGITGKSGLSLDVFKETPEGFWPRKIWVRT